MFFWAGILMLALALAPDFGVLGPATERGREKAGIQDVFYIVSETVSDMGEICGRRPRVCEKIDRIWEQFCNRAVYVTGAAHDWLLDRDFTEKIPADADTPSRGRPVPPEREPDGDDMYLAETAPDHRH